MTHVINKSFLSIHTGFQMMLTTVDYNSSDIATRKKNWQTNTALHLSTVWNIHEYEAHLASVSGADTNIPDAYLLWLGTHQTTQTSPLRLLLGS